MAFPFWMTKIIQLQIKHRLLRLLLFCVLTLDVITLTAVEASPVIEQAPPEPPSYRMENYQATTPATLRGARVVSTEEAHRLWDSKSALFIDTMPRAPKPKNLPANTIWHDKPRFNIPGSIWLVDVGYGALSEERDRYFREHLKTLTEGDKGRALLFYCKVACWMSWNAAKRAMEEYGYENVIWYPEGTEGWEAAGLKLIEAQPVL
jgi:PQQ-dependent catabolism-associated CXXCW motif protein